MLEFLPSSQMPDQFGGTLGYSDGDVEERLLELFGNTDEQAIAEEIERILQNNPSWPERAHLSPQRQHLLDWYPFRQDATLLELGAGCGALTGLLCDRVSHVDAVDLSVRRAQILQRRHRGRRNLRVLVGDLASLVAQRPSYQYVVAVGVLEYAGRYVRPPTDRSPMAPYQQFLSDIHTILAPGGTLLLAIENQLGAKYLAGGAEDHYGQPLVGVEDYVVDAGIRTFGKNELQRLITQAGLQVIRFYYPVPDYKLPTAVYSDELPPGSIDHIGLLYPSVDYAYPQGDYFDEGRFMHAAARNQVATRAAKLSELEYQR